jgi:methanesulfonate monooxygenase small subunit
MTTGTATRNGVDSAVRDLIYRSCLRLDAGDFPGWLELCAPDFRYTITAYSPGIRKEMT